jgi:hypothetical protein
MAENLTLAEIRARNRKLIDQWLAGGAFVDKEKADGEVWYQSQ